MRSSLHGAVRSSSRRRLLVSRAQATRALAQLEARRAADPNETDAVPLGWRVRCWRRESISACPLAPLTFSRRALHEHFTAARDVHALAAWSAQRRRWASLRTRLSAATGKPASRLTMERCAAARLRSDAARLRELATPLEERCGAAAWACSLRDNWELRLPVSSLGGLGGAAEGLEGVRHVAGESLNRLGLCVSEQVTLSAAGAAAAASLAPSPPVSSADILEGDGEEIGGLSVRGLGLRSLLHSLGSPSSPTVEQAVRFLCAHGHAEAAARVAAAAEAAAAQSTPSSSSERSTAEMPPADALSPALPSLLCSPQMLCFRGRLRPHPSGSQASMELTNTGPLTLYWSWDWVDSTAAPGDSAEPRFLPLPPAKRAGPLGAPLLPGESVQAAFRFAPRAGCAPGATVREIWRLRTAPELPGEGCFVLLAGEVRLGKGEEDILEKTETAIVRE